MARRLGLVVGIGSVVVVHGEWSHTSKTTGPRELETVVTPAVMIRATHAEPVPAEPRHVVERVQPAREVVVSVVVGPVASKEPIAIAVESQCTPHWHVADLDRCLDGDGDGCVGVGDDYETNACDAYSSIKWYRRGCRLGSAGACGALVRLGEPVPPPPY